MTCLYVNPLVLELIGCSAEQAHGWKLTDTIPFDEVGMKLFRLVSSTLASGEKSESELEARLGIATWCCMCAACRNAISKAR